jgi:hypothetical protein
LRRLYILAAACSIAGLAPAQEPGIAPDWEVRANVTGLVAHARQLKPILEQARPQQWSGAPAAYAEQAKRISAEIEYLITTAQSLAARPDRLTIALGVYFRMQSLDLMLRSFADGVRKYQNPALAELLLGAVSTLAADRSGLQQYVQDLTADREQALKVADEEAQRCRGVLSRQPRPASARPAHKERQ